MLDAIHFEETGKPAVVVATSHFVQQATSLKKSMNLEGLPLVVVPHPLGEQEVAAAKAQAAAADIVKSVTHEPFGKLRSALNRGYEDMVVGKTAVKLSGLDTVEGAIDTIEQYFDNGWTDGLPIVPVG